MPRQIPSLSDIPVHGWSPYSDMHRERIAAHSKHDALDASVERVRWDDPVWLRILMEEVGEAAHELSYDTKSANPIAALRAELVQVGAMVAAWIDAIDEGPR